MKLRADGLKPGPELDGTIVVLTDSGEPTGVEHSGNYSKGAKAAGKGREIPTEWFLQDIRD